MRLSFSAPLLVLLLAANLCAQTEPAGSALGALRLLPRGEAKRLARIVARDGTPVPERWHFIVHDPKAETGVHEYVVASGEIVASRAVSQFAESLRAEDVVGGDALKVNSDRAAKLAQQYALANNVTVAAMHYELKKEGAAAAPLWSVTCLDEAGKTLGHLVISAGKGSVVSHEGFPAEPPPPVPPAAALTPEERLRQPASDPATFVVGDPVAPPPPATPEPKKPGILDRVGAGLQKVFTGKERKSPAE